MPHFATRFTAILARGRGAVLLLAAGLAGALANAGYAVGAVGDEGAEGTEGADIYARLVLPIFKQRCFACHSHESGMARGGLVVDSRAALLQGGDTGPAIDLAEPGASRLLRAVRYQDDSLQMPPDGPISSEELATLEKWIQLGAPAAASASSDGAKGRDERMPSAAGHWAFQPLTFSPIPRGEDDRGAVGARHTTDIDQHLTVARRRMGTVTVGRASKETLVRRIYFDLWGLPPTPGQIEEFTADSSSGAWNRLVDRLLSAPEFGERWGRHWLDVARYADSNGCSIESNNTYDDAWRYRDYVIASFYEDKPFDRFVREQVAGDLLPALSDQQRAEQIIATGFLLLGPKAFGSPFDQLRMDVIDEQIDTVGKAFLGLALGCARCHDHKLDPISTRDYYALAGIFSSTASVQTEKGWRNGRGWNRVPLPTVEAATAQALRQQHDQRLADAQAGKLQPILDRALNTARAELDRLKNEKASAEAIAAAQQQLTRAERDARNGGRLAKVLPIVSPVPTAMAVTDSTEVRDESIRIRGSLDKPGDVVPRGLTQLLHGTDPRFHVPDGQSGRVQLAQWLTDVEQGAGGLLARVTVNRVWNHLIGQPLVASVDNFGLSGTPPIHPDLLEYLASEFVRQGWSVKQLVRQIVTSEAYCLAPADHPESLTADPANITLWRRQTRRLDAEAVRDALLSISGQIDNTRGGKTLQYLGLISIDSDYLDLDTPSPYRRRTVYLPILRDAVEMNGESDEALTMLATFDFADPNLMRGAREVTTVPTQSLLMLNSPWILKLSQLAARRVLDHAPAATDEDRLQFLYELILNRPISADDMARALHFLAQFSQAPDRGTSADAAAGAAERTVDAAPDAADIRLAAWTSLCQSILGSAEFLFLF